jgi:hypothetical protein
MDHPIDHNALISLIDHDRVRSIILDTVNVRSNVRLILISTSPIDHGRIIGSTQYFIDQSVLLQSIKHPIEPIALVLLIVIEFNRQDSTK